MADDVPSPAIESAAPDRDPDRPRALAWEEYSRRALDAYHQVLAKDPPEKEVQRFLELHPSMVPGGSGDVGPGGHHGSTHSALFSEPELTGAGRDFEPDFMWVTRSTSLITPILIEIEKPSKRWFRRDGRPTAEFTQAHDQLNDWRSWFARDANRAMFRERFMIGGERFPDRPLEPLYVLIFGRSKEFDPGGGHVDAAALRHKRDQQRAADEAFMTFDSLRPRADHASSLTVHLTATGAKAFAFSPVYGTDTRAGVVSSDIRGIDGALDRTVMMTPERREYLKGRFRHWSDYEKRLNTTNALRVRRTGIE